MARAFEGAMATKKGGHRCIRLWVRGHGQQFFRGEDLSEQHEGSERGGVGVGGGGWGAA